MLPVNSFFSFEVMKTSETVVGAEVMGLEAEGGIEDTFSVFLGSSTSSSATLGVIRAEFRLRLKEFRNEVLDCGEKEAVC